MVLLSAAAFVAILLVGSISLFMMNEVRIGGTAYNYIQKDKDALESIALLKSDLFQINSEMQNFMLEADPAIAEKNIATIKNLTKDIELNFGIALESVESPGKHDAINKANTIWKEYRKTLLDEVLPSAVKGDVLKAGYLMTGIQAQRFSTFSKLSLRWLTVSGRMSAPPSNRLQQGIRKKITVSAVITIVAIGLIALFSYFITTSITRPLRSCVEFAKEMAGGRLDARLEVRGGGEAADLAHAMNIMAENLHRMVSRIRLCLRSTHLHRL